MPARRTDLDTDYLVREYLSGTSVRALSIEAGAASQVIKNLLTGAGVSIRGRSAAGLLRAQRDPQEVRDRRVQRLVASRKGRPASDTHKTNIATAKFQAGSQNVGRGEKDVAAALREGGFDVREQVAVGPYNLDLSAGMVDVEIHTATHGPHLDRHGRHRRVKYLLDRGWTVVYVWSHRGISACDMERVVSNVHRLSSYPPPPGQYAVIRCYGKTAPRRRSEGYDLTYMVTASDGVDAPC